MITYTNTHGVGVFSGATAPADSGQTTQVTVSPSVQKDTREEQLARGQQQLLLSGSPSSRTHSCQHSNEMRSTLGVSETCPDLHTSFPHEPHTLVTTPQAWFPGSPHETLPGLRSHPIHGNPKASPSGIYNSSRSRSILLVWDHLCHKQRCLITQMASFLIRLLEDKS